MDAKRIERVYSAYSGVYDRIWGKVFQPSREALAGAIRPRSGDRILEVGVGTGLLLPEYPTACSVIGIDLSDGMLAKARERVRELGLKHVKLERMDAGHMTFADDTFDIVVAAYVVTAVPDYRAVMNEMIRVCKPGGRILMVNHFVNGNGLLAVCERAISPLCKHLGFRTDLSLKQVLDGAPLSVNLHEKVRPLKMWHLVECLNRKHDARPAALAA